MMMPRGRGLPLREVIHVHQTRHRPQDDQTSDQEGKHTRHFTDNHLHGRHLTPALQHFPREKTFVKG
jgi:hypothetical protein